MAALLASDLVAFFFECCSRGLKVGSRSILPQNAFHFLLLLVFSWSLIRGDHKFTSLNCSKCTQFLMHITQILVRTCDTIGTNDSVMQFSSPAICCHPFTTTSPKSTCFRLQIKQSMSCSQSTSPKVSHQRKITANVYSWRPRCGLLVLITPLCEHAAWCGAWCGAPWLLVWRMHAKQRLLLWLAGGSGATQALVEVHCFFNPNKHN